MAHAISSDLEVNSALFTVIFNIEKSEKEKTLPIPVTGYCTGCGAWRFLSSSADAVADT